MYSCYIIRVNIRKQIITDTNPNNWTAYTAMGETDEYQYGCVFTMVKCCAVKLSAQYESYQVFRWGVLARLLKISFLFGRTNMPRLLSGGSGLVPDTHEIVVVNMHGAHSKHSSLILISFQ